MNDAEIRDVILRGICSDRSYFAQAYLKSVHRHRSGLLMLQRHKNALAGIVRYEPSAWMDRPLEPIERKQFSRVLSDLEEAGLLIRHKDERGRTLNIELTSEGEQLAEILQSNPK